MRLSANDGLSEVHTALFVTERPEAILTFILGIIIVSDFYSEINYVVYALLSG